VIFPDILAPMQYFPDTEERVHLKHGWQLRDYQQRAAYKVFLGEPVTDLATGKKRPDWPVRDGVAVHIDPGLGKTIIGLTAIAEWFKQGILSEGEAVLIVAPIKVCETVWAQEAASWSHTRHLTFQLVRGSEKERTLALSRPAHVYLVNPEMLVWLQKWVRYKWTSKFKAVIIDESSMFKDNRAKRFRVLSNYGTRETVKNAKGKTLYCPVTGEPTIIGPERFKRFAVLTGTPSPSGLQNLWAPFYFLDHGARLHKKFDTFQGRFFHKERQVAAHTFKMGLNPEEDELRPDWQVRDGSKERIHELISDCTVELNANDYGVLPSVLPPFEHYVDLPEDVRPFYRQLEKEAVFEMLKDPVIAANGGAKSNMCWQICNGAMYTTDDYGKREVKVIHDNKIDKLVELVTTLDKNCIITYHFNHDRDRIVERFRKEGIPYAVLGGKHSQSIIDRWNEGKIPNLLLHPQSAGHGLNLQFGGHTLIWFTPIWSLERWLQTNARIARSGQPWIVSIHVILTQHTTDLVRFKSLFERGEDMDRFRKATLAYQKTMGIDVGSLGSFEGVSL
jgi:SNF2 family DNA or RNA helicase